MCFSSRNSHGGKHIFVCKKNIGKTLSGAPAPAPPKGELCAIFRAAAPSVWKKLVTGTQKKLPPSGELASHSDD